MSEESFRNYVYRIRNYTNCDSRDHEGIFWASDTITQLQANLKERAIEKDNYEESLGELQAESDKLREAAEIGGGFMEGILETLIEFKIILPADVVKCAKQIATIKAALPPLSENEK
jgi:hypothetical protein